MTNTPNKNPTANPDQSDAGKVVGELLAKFKAPWKLSEKLPGLYEDADGKQFNFGGSSIAMICGLVNAIADQFEAMRAEVERLRAIVNPLNEIRQEEGTIVEIFCDNPDFGSGPDAAIEVNADWTQNNYERFTGANLAECLAKAAAARTARSRA